MSDVPKVAILLATYNGAEWIRIQVESIAMQEGVEIFVFVNDDCSNDETVEILRNLNLNVKLKILKIRERFGSAAANFIDLIGNVDFQGFDYIFLSDQDDYWHPKKIIAAISLLKIDGADCYASNLRCIGAGTDGQLLRKDYAQTKYDFLFQGASAGCTYGMTSKAAMLIQEVFKARKNGPWEKISHDWLIYAITRSRGIRWVIDSRAFIDYRQHSKNAWGALGFKSYIKRWRLVRNGWYRKNIEIVSEFCQLDPTAKLLVVRFSRWTVVDRIFLISRFMSFRRRPVEKIAFGLMVLFGIV